MTLEELKSLPKPVTLPTAAVNVAVWPAFEVLGNGGVLVEDDGFGGMRFHYIPGWKPQA